MNTAFANRLNTCATSQIRQLLLTRAEACRKAAADLQTMVGQFGGSAEASGSATGAMHRDWVAVKGALAGYTDKAILGEPERGEDVSLASYRKAQAKDLPLAARVLVERQVEGAQRNHGEVRPLRDQVRATSK